MMTDHFEKLYDKLHYRFSNEDLLVLALTHRSKGGLHNERLEFLGDSIINCIIADVLYQQFPKASEGELSRWRAVLVNRESLANLARHFNLSDYLYLGAGELKNGGGQRLSILSCAMEAIIGAIYLDSSFEQTRQVSLLWYEDMLASLSSASSHKDPKTLLQELLQARHLPLPHYAIDKVEGAAHKQIFVIACSVEGLPQKTTGRGSSRRRAEQAAAKAMLGVLAK